MTSIIVAITSDWAIGKKGDQLYYISDDLKRFKALTADNTVIMGRKTFEALPNGALKGRKNIVITRNKDFTAPDITVCNSLDEALSLADGEPFIIGGGSIYREALDSADRIYMTVIDTERPDADTFFPKINTESNAWSVDSVSEKLTDERSGLTYRFIDLKRVR